ncbi:RNA-splicing ligase RtcB, partial [Candidatus Acetothermia bacterium]
MAEGYEIERVSDAEWLIPATGAMRVPGRVFVDPEMMEDLQGELSGEWSALRQVRNVATLPGIVGVAVALPDVHPGYGFPIGGVGAFDPDEGVVVVGGVGFDINCGVRLMRTPLSREEVEDHRDALADDLYRTVPAGLGSTGKLRLSLTEIDRLLAAGAEYVISHGYGLEADLEFIEDGGRIPGADPGAVSRRAKER